MRFRTALFAVAMCVAGPALAQISPSATPQKPPAQPAHPSAQPAPAKSLAPAADKAEKTDPAKEAAIRHLMDITETSKLGDNMAAYINNQVKSVMSRTIPPENLSKFMDTFSEKFAEGAPSSAITASMVPIYARAFSLEDIQSLVKFYESPLGQRVVRTLPDVLQESQNAGMQIDQNVAINVLRGMSADYPQLKQVLPPETDQPQPAPAAGAPPAAKPSPASPQN